MGNPVVHFDLTGPEAELTAKFYGELFGWHIQSVPVPQGTYHLIDTHAGKGINGGIMQTSEGQQPFATVYAEVDDIRATLDKAEKLGAKTVVPVTAMEMVTFALFTDPDGNVIGLVQSDPSQQGPGVSPGDNPPVSWFEIQPHVNVYATVDNLQRYLDRAESLGGKPIVPPTDMGGVQFALLGDPQGTGFGLVLPPTT